MFEQYEEHVGGRHWLHREDDPIVRGESFPSFYV